MGSRPFTSSSGAPEGQALCLKGFSALLLLQESKRTRRMRDRRGAGTKGPCRFGTAQICLSSVVTLSKHLLNLVVWEKRGGGFPSLGWLLETLKTMEWKEKQAQTLSLQVGASLKITRWPPGSLGFRAGCANAGTALLQSCMWKCKATGQGNKADLPRTKAGKEDGCGEGEQG